MHRNRAGARRDPTVHRLIRWLALALVLCLGGGVALFYYNANHDYLIDAGFTPIPLDYDPHTNTSRYDWNGTQVTVTGGFVKGTQRVAGGETALLVRALSPVPGVVLDSPTARAAVILIENINPGRYSELLAEDLPDPVQVDANTFRFNLSLPVGETQIRATPPQITEEDVYVIMGDNRDGYDTLDRAIGQINALDPWLVINNGDLVFSGKPNQYRLFDRSMRPLGSTLALTLGNHDIRRNGREIFTRLYGPNYYSFELGDSYFIFLDSSPAWTELTAISAEQYVWLEDQLKAAQGHNIYVVTHVPPTDPRPGTTKNLVPDYIQQVQDDSRFETLLDNYVATKSMNHGFQDRAEAAKFEALMAQYGVQTVYLSHIHSYLDFDIKGVRYVVTGGAGAELLTTDSFYHYIISRFDTQTPLSIVELPTPPNNQIARFRATASLFTRAFYLENRAAVTVFLIGLSLLVAMLVLLASLRIRHTNFWTLTKDTGSYLRSRRRELYPHRRRLRRS